MQTKLYIGTEQADFNDPFNVVFSIGDIRDIRLGSNNKSYTLSLPLTKTNKRLLKFADDPSVRTEISDTGYLFFGDMLILKGKVIVLSVDSSAKILISADDWVNQLGPSKTRSLEKDKMRDLDLSAYNYTLTNANITGSWTALNAFYRYPMIYFGECMGGSGTPRYLTNYDFIPMFRLYELMTELFKPYTISSTFINSAYFKSKYVLSTEFRFSDSFISGKDLNVNQNSGDNYKYRMTILAGGAGNTTYNQIPLQMTSETDDKANAWGTNQYVVPETGIYRFVGRITGLCAVETPDVVVTGSSFDFSLKRNSTVLCSDSQSWGDASLNAYISNYDSGYVLMTKGDIITIEVTTSAQANNTSGTTNLWCDHGTNYGAANTYLSLDWSKYNQMLGLNDTVVVADWMPDMTQIDFLKGIKDAFNLMFFVDQRNQVIYIEPADTFYGTTVIDLTTYQDFSNNPYIENISHNYAKKLYLQWKEDQNDEAIKAYKIANDIPFRKTIDNTSIYCVQGWQSIENNCFGYAPTMKALGYYLESWDLPSLWGNRVDDLLDRPAYRNPSGVPVLLNWEGSTANPEGSWSFSGAAQANYPKVTQLDMNDLYTYFIKSFHYLDKGKIATIQAKLPQWLIIQFTTVVNNSANEGFRATYKFEIEGKEYYGLVNKITTDGELSELELIIK